MFAKFFRLFSTRSLKKSVRKISKISGHGAAQVSSGTPKEKYVVGKMGKRGR